MKIKVTTETGSYYHINTEARKWSKNHYEQHDVISEWRAGPYEGREQHAFDGIAPWYDIRYPVVGLCMYISGRGPREWHVSTEVVSIEVDPADWDDRLN